jgi:3-methyladenine DNA glycosylase AlkD
MTRQITLASVLDFLEKHSNPANVQGMERFGIKTNHALGIDMPMLRLKARELRKNHELALQLWDSGIHEARILASLCAEPEKLTEAQAEKWVADFDNWGICDQVCLNLFDRLPFAGKKILEWAKRDEEYVRRAAFALIAVLAVHDKEMSDSDFEKFLPLIEKYSTDERNFVRKAVNWALRQTGKRNDRLCRASMALAKKLKAADSSSARWIGSDALRELEKRAK